MRWQGWGHVTGERDKRAATWEIRSPCFYLLLRTLLLQRLSQAKPRAGSRHEAERRGGRPRRSWLPWTVKTERKGTPNPRSKTKRAPGRSYQLSMTMLRKGQRPEAAFIKAQVLREPGGRPMRHLY